MPTLHGRLVKLAGLLNHMQELAIGEKLVNPNTVVGGSFLGSRVGSTQPQRLAGAALGAAVGSTEGHRLAPAHGSAWGALKGTLASHVLSYGGHKLTNSGSLSRRVLDVVAAGLPEAGAHRGAYNDAKAILHRQQSKANVRLVGTGVVAVGGGAYALNKYRKKK